jgi:hypothetical protein
MAKILDTPRNFTCPETKALCDQGECRRDRCVLRTPNDYADIRRARQELEELRKTPKIIISWDLPSAKKMGQVTNSLARLKLARIIAGPGTMDFKLQQAKLDPEIYDDRYPNSPLLGFLSEDQIRHLTQQAEDERNLT